MFRSVADGVWVDTVCFHVIAVINTSLDRIDVHPTVILHTLLVVVSAELCVRKFTGRTFPPCQFFSNAIGFRLLLRPSILQFVVIFHQNFFAFG